MPDPAALRLLLPAAAAMAALLVAGVAAALFLYAQRPVPPTPWPRRLRLLAAASPGSGRHLLALLLLLVAAQLLRRLLPPSLFGDLFAFHGVAFIAALLFALRRPRPGGLPLPARTLLAQALLRWLAVLPLLWFASFVWNLLLAWMGHPAGLQLAIRLFLDSPSPGDRALFAVFAVFLAPVAEEFLFRGLLLPLLVRRTGPLPGLLLSSLAFALLHADPGSFVALALFSVALSLAYARTGSLRVPIAMHMLFNAANLLLLLALARAGVV